MYIFKLRSSCLTGSFVAADRSDIATGIAKMTASGRLSIPADASSERAFEEM